MPASASAVRILKILAKVYPEKGMVDLGNADDTLLATILSARARDSKVLEIFPAFRKRFPTWSSLAKARLPDLERSISSINFYRNKARSIKKLAIVLLEQYDGRVPGTMEELVALPGVGRKTASCVLSYVFNVPAIAVDTHVFRVAHRLGWTRREKPEQVEKDVMVVVPKRLWSEVNRVIVPFGREICTSRKPKCGTCPIWKECPWAGKTDRSL